MLFVLVNQISVKMVEFVLEMVKNIPVNAIGVIMVEIRVKSQTHVQYLPLGCVTRHEQRANLQKIIMTLHVNVNMKDTNLQNK